MSAAGLAALAGIIVAILAGLYGAYRTGWSHGHTRAENEGLIARLLAVEDDIAASRKAAQDFEDASDRLDGAGPGEHIDGLWGDPQAKDDGDDGDDGLDSPSPAKGSPVIFDPS